MHIFIIVLHLIVCFALILIVLLQTGKGASMGAMFGGAGNQTLFGSTGASTFLSKATTAAAVIFMITSLSLAYVSQSGTDSVIQDYQPAGGQQEQTQGQPPGQTGQTGQTVDENAASEPGTREPIQQQQNSSGSAGENTE